MKKAPILIWFCLAASAQTLVSLQTGSGAATGTLSNFPLGSFQWSMRFHNLPASAPGSDLVLVQLNTPGNLIKCVVPGGTLNITCLDGADASPLGAAALPLKGATDIRLVATRFRDATYGQIRLDMWAGDCSGYQWSVMPALYQGGEASTSSQSFQIGGGSVAVAFLRADNFPVRGIGATPSCPADAPAAIAPNMDFRFEGSTLTSVDNARYTLTASGSNFVNSPTYNPACSVTSSSSAPRPVVPLGVFTLTSTSITLNSAANGNAPASFSWTQTSGPMSTIDAPSAPSINVTPSADGSYTYQLQVSDAVNSSSCSFNIGVVNSDVNGIKLQTNAELGEIIGDIPRYGTSPWPWYEQAEATDADVLLPYWQAPPAPATLFTGTGTNDVFFSGRGPFAGLPTDTYDVRISANGMPDSYQWRKNGGAWSASIPITENFCYGDPRTLPVTDGVIICFGSTSGHTLNDMWTRMAPQQGTASITGTGNNHVDSATGFVCGGSAPPCSGNITVMGTGTQWSTGTGTQKLKPGDRIWLEWDADGNGTNSGRYVTTVASVLDDTHFTTGGDAGYWRIPTNLSASMTVQEAGSPDSNPLWNNNTQLYNLNYYEAILGVIRLAEATNLSTYINEAQAACNNWWQYAVDHGYNLTGVPRNAGWQSLAACASKFGNSWWDGIASNLEFDLLTTFAGLGGSDRFATPVNRDNGSDIRETTYETRATAILTRVYPSHTSNPSATRTKWCSYLANQINNFWLDPWAGSSGRYTLTNSGQDAYWQENLLVNHIAFPAAGNPPGPNSSTVFGTSPWRDSGLGTIALTEAYKSFSSSPDCNNPSLATSAQNAAQLTTAFMWDYGRAADGGLYYNVEYLSQQGSDNAVFGGAVHNLADKYSEGFVTVTGGTSVATSSGAGGFFTRRFAPCSGTSSIAINGNSYVVLSCTDDNHLTLASAAPNGTFPYHNTASIQVTNGSATVIGMGTGFLNAFAPCDGTTYMGILGATSVDNSVYRVTACADDTHLTLNTPWAGASQTSQNDFAVSLATPPAWWLAAHGSCSPSISTHCEPDGFSDKNLAHDWTVSLGQVYQWSHNLLWRTRLETGLGENYGGPPLGPSFSGMNYGPQAAGANNFDSVIPSCFSTLTVQPCTNDGNGDGFRFGNYSKTFGMSAGAGNARQAIANYLTGSSTTLRRDTINKGTEFK